MGNKTVMIIEDDMLHMKLFNDILENQGYNTLTAHDGDIAIEMARKSRPDLIILNIQVPFTSGFEVIKRLKNEDHLKDIPVLAVTAFDDDMKKDEYLRHGFDGFLVKPIAIPNFLGAVAGFISPAPYAVQ